MPHQHKAVNVVCHVMKSLIILYCIFFFIISCNDSGDKNIITKSTETDSTREERHLHEAILDLTKKLNLPILKGDPNKIEIRIWISDFLKGESILIIRMEDKNVSIWETHFWQSYPKWSWKKKDTSNHFLQVKVDSSKIKSIDLKVDQTRFIDTVTNAFISNFPKKTDFSAIAEATTDGSGLLFEISNQKTYQYLVYRCFSSGDFDIKPHEHIKAFLNFIRQNTNASIPECN
jgi:hypothetical protein